MRRSATRRRSRSGRVVLFELLRRIFPRLVATLPGTILSVVPVVTPVLFLVLSFVLSLGIGAVQADEEIDTEFLRFPAISPQDIAFDGETFWITVLLSSRVYNFSADLKTELKQLVVPGEPLALPTGVAFDPVGTNGNGSLYVGESFNTFIVEMDRDGVEIRRIIPQFLPGTLVPEFLYGMAFNPHGDGGRGSLFVVELQGTIIYEFDLNGNVLSWFLHPKDPDGFPGVGLSTPASDVEPIFENDRVTGFYLTAGDTIRDELMRVNAEGKYEGIAISLAPVGGTVSAVLRSPFPRPSDGEIVDSFIFVVESTAEIAILPAVEPSIRELVDVEAQMLNDTVFVEWDSFDAYDSIEVYERCELVETIDGDAPVWQHDFGYDGVFEITLRATRGELATESDPVLAVVGPGAVHNVTLLPDVTDSVDIATDGNGLFLVTDRRQDLVVLLDEDFVQLATLPVDEPFLGDGNWLTGVATDGIRIYLYNLHTFTVAQMDGIGGIERTFELQLPNLEEDPTEPPNRGAIYGMTYDDRGAGSLWVVELARRTIYQVNLSGRVLSSFVHPYVNVFPPAPGVDDPILASGISSVPGAPDELYLSGGIAGSGRQTHILRVKKETGEIVPDSQIPLAGFTNQTGTSTVFFAAFSRDGEARLAVLPFGHRREQIVELQAGEARVSAPTFLHVQQTGYDNTVTGQFLNTGTFNSVDVERDCALIESIAGDSTTFVDENVPPGEREYAVRGGRAGENGDDAHARLRVGQGAVLVKKDTQPSLAGWQLAEDPTTRDYYLITNEHDRERTIYTYDRNFNYLRQREANPQPPSQDVAGVGACETILGFYWDGGQCQSLSACSCTGADCGDLFDTESDCETAFVSTWELSTLAVRVDPQRNRELVLIASERINGFGQGGTEEFLLIKENMQGEVLAVSRFDPPRPSRGAVTFIVGLTWEPFTDTFYFLARNSDLFVHMTANGEITRTFAHPCPPFQDFVFNIGLDFVPERGTLFFTGADLFDSKVSRVMEMDLDGNLTGFEIPFSVEGYELAPIHIRGYDLVTVGTLQQSRSAFFRMKAFAGLPDPFLRGDSTGNGNVDISDVIRSLDHLFAGSPQPICEDAADVDDDGRISIGDPVRLLGHLFNGGPPPAAPHPAPGIDPTPDGLQCFEL